MVKRYDWLDCLKGFGAILVILGHLYPDEPIERYIYSFHMPLFFFISGLLKRKKEQKLSVFVKNKAKSLLIPLLAWNIVSTVFFMIIGYNRDKLIYGAFFINGMLPGNTPIWFLLNLFLCEVCYEILSSHKVPDIAIIIPLLLSGLIICRVEIIPFTLYILPFSLSFYATGSMLRPIILEGEFTAKKKIALPVTLMFSILFGLILNGRITMARGYYDNILFFLVGSFCGVIAWTLIFKILPPSRLLQKIGKQSLFLMCFQYFIFVVANEISTKFFDFAIWTEVDTIKAVICTVAVTAVCFLVLSIPQFFEKKNRIIAKSISWFGIQVNS